MRKIIRFFVFLLTFLVVLRKAYRLLKRTGILKGTVLGASRLVAHPILDKLYEANEFIHLEETPREDDDKF